MLLWPCGRFVLLSEQSDWTVPLFDEWVLGAANFPRLRNTCRKRGEFVEKWLKACSDLKVIDIFFDK